MFGFVRVRNNKAVHFFRTTCECPSLSHVSPIAISGGDGGSPPPPFTLTTVLKLEGGWKEKC